MSKAKYILTVIFIAGVIATQSCSVDPLGPWLLIISTGGGVTCALFAVCLRAWKEIHILLLLSFLSIISFPSLLDRCRTHSNDEAAVINLRTIAVSEVTYRSSSEAYGSIEQLIGARLLDSRFTGIVAGYRYEVFVSIDGMSYVAKAIRASPENGNYEYYVQSDGIVRHSSDAAPRGLAGKPVP